MTLNGSSDTDYPFGYGENKEMKKKPISIGDRFKLCESAEDHMYHGHRYILANTFFEKISLIDLGTGEMYTCPVRVRNVTDIRPDEWREITGGSDFRRYRCRDKTIIW